MKKLLIGAAVAAASTFAQAAHMDVIAFQMTGECSFGEYMEVVGDFNEWAEPHGYSTQILMPLASDDLQTHFWVGTSADSATFGAAYDMWMQGLADDDSTPADLNERLAECSTLTARSSYLSY
jgi:hypothetical protein